MIWKGVFEGNSIDIRSDRIACWLFRYNTEHVTDTITAGRHCDEAYEYCFEFILHFSLIFSRIFGQAIGRRGGVTTLLPVTPIDT